MKTIYNFVFVKIIGGVILSTRARNRALLLFEI